MKNINYRKMSLRPLSAAAGPGSCCSGAAVVVVVTQTLQMCCRCTAPDTAVLQPPASCCMQSPPQGHCTAPLSTHIQHWWHCALLQGMNDERSSKPKFSGLEILRSNSTGLGSDLNVFNFMWGTLQIWLLRKCRQSPADCSRHVRL